MMQDQRIGLTIGVLIVGSLYWDPQSYREAWRRSRLDIRSQYLVKCPIRYGRESRSRNNTYTVVFSQLCSQREAELGQAIAVRCQHGVCSLDNLINEARQLWRAERPANAALDNQLSASWGCVALLPNPESNIPKFLLDGWASYVLQDGNYGNFRHAENEEPVVNRRGLLNIPWPKLVNCTDALPLDLLLATATNPTFEGQPRSYPSAEAIAERWNRDSQGHVRYFYNNQANGIYTFQDQAISGALTVR
jgi:hypothetical protein